jgi:hypothetical protein
MGENENKESAMASTEENKSKSKKAKPKSSKPKAAKNGKAHLNEIGLPMRPKYDCQVGIRLNEEERAALIARCQKEGHHSLSNCIRVVLGFEPLR